MRRGSLPDGGGTAIIVVVAAIGVATSVQPRPLLAGAPPASRSEMQGVPFAEDPQAIAMIGEGDSFEDIFEEEKVTASSTLAPAGATHYDAGLAHDSDLNTAWAPAANRHDGIGEYLEFRLRTNPQTESDPSLSGMIVFNGYRKSRALWQRNNRVRRLRMSVDGKPYGVITLADDYRNQRVAFGTIPLPPHDRELVLRFTIDAVYRGTASHDTLISEIELKGIGIY